MSILILPIRHLLDLLVSEIKQEKEVKFIQGNKGRNKILFADEKAVYIEKLPKSTQKLLKPIKWDFQGQRIQHQHTTSCVSIYEH